jgi:DtxR family Mn-dependent transcriptional regulator
MSARTPAISSAMEDYLKTIHQIAEETGGAAVQTQAISDRLAVSTASVTGMMKKLDQYHLVEHEPYRGVVLTPKGEQVALEVLRHHRLLELYLVEQLGMSWEDVHAEADRLDVKERGVLVLAERLWGTVPTEVPARIAKFRALFQRVSLVCFIFF